MQQLFWSRVPYNEILLLIMIVAAAITTAIATTTTTTTTIIIIKPKQKITLFSTSNKEFWAEIMKPCFLLHMQGAVRK